MMSRITGTGCQLSALITAYITANQRNSLEAVVALCVQWASVAKAYAG